MHELRDQIVRVARHEAHTMICGEPGSGKELAARYLASRSARADQPFVVALGEDRLLRGDARQPGGAVERVAEGGFASFSVDLMFGLPGQTAAEDQDHRLLTDSCRHA